MLEGAAQKKSRLGSDSKLSPPMVCFGDVMLTNVPLSIIDYNSIKNGELVQASSIINENDAVDILFDCTDGYKTCKLYMHLLLLASARPPVPSVWPSVP
jgi:hypothetical protein